MKNFLSPLWLLLIPAWLVAAPPDAYQAEVESLKKNLAEMVKADTSNPPGNESRIVALVAKRFDAESIPYQVVEFAPGRQCIVARLKGTGAEKPLLMLAHIDVVGTQNQSWSSDPHTVTEKDGFLVGRGVSDDLGMAATELEVFLQLKRSGVGLRRDVILALTGDEESGGLGIRYLLDHRPELIDAATAINEGGGLVLGNDGKVKLVALQSAEKNYQDFTLTAQGTTGHSSVPLPDNAIYRLSRALDRVGRLVMPVRLSPLTREYFARRASLEPPAVKAAMLTLSRAQGTPPASALRVIEKDPTLSASLRTTCVATLLQGGTKENALPPSAQATINCRILPEESVSEVQKRLAQAIADRGVAIQPVSDFGLAGASPTDGEVPKAVEKITHALWPSAPVIPFMSRGATDSRYLRMKGITAYGIDPIALTEEDGRRAHGVDERISIASLAPAIDFLHRLVLELAAQDLTR